MNDNQLIVKWKANSTNAVIFIPIQKFTEITPQHVFQLPSGLIRVSLRSSDFTWLFLYSRGLSFSGFYKVYDNLMLSLYRYSVCSSLVVKEKANTMNAILLMPIEQLNTSFIHQVTKSKSSLRSSDFTWIILCIDGFWFVWVFLMVLKAH